MSNHKFTPGPWEVTPQQTHNGSFFRVKGESVKVANIVTRDYKTAEANAKLIAAAPDLLYLAKKYLAFIKNSPLEYEEDFEYRDYVESVIKKATE